MKYIATKEFSFGFHGNRFKAGDEVPTEFVTARILNLGLVKKVVTETVEASELEILTEGPESSDVTVEVIDENEDQPDWEWIESLASTRENKNLLDDYAAEKFDIKLNANQKIADMIADFKENLQ